MEAKVCDGGAVSPGAPVESVPMAWLGPLADRPSTPRSNDDKSKEAIEEVACRRRRQDEDIMDDDEPEDVIEEIALEYQDQHVLEHNDDEVQEVIEGIASKYQGYCYFLAFCFPISRKETQQQVRTMVHDAQLKRFFLSELQVATDNFNKNNILGRGVFGRVYKGKLSDGSLVAVKRQRERSPDGDLQFETEVTMVSMEVHRNLLRLGGFCMTPTERLLVYPYMPNGSVASWLHERQPSEPPLDWNTRRRIAVGSARGLSCLHENCDPKIIHRDVKSANVLLDEDFEAVVGDFGVARLMNRNITHETTRVYGTIGHVAPEYQSTGRCSEKADVFSYGVMLLELVTGKRVYDPSSRAADDASLLRWVTRVLKEKKVDANFEMFADPELSANYDGTELESLIQVALLCTDDSPSDRPPMSEVLRLLEGDGLAERWDDWQMQVTERQVDDNQLEQIHHTSTSRAMPWIQQTTLRSEELSGQQTTLRSEELSGPR